MSNYTKLTDYASKDALSSGNPSKLIKGTEIDADFLSIQTNMATKIDSTTAASPTVVTTLADADQLRMWNNSASAERQITALNAGLYFGYRLQYGTPWTSTSGASNDWTIPTWARRITILFNGVSLTGNSDFLVQLGDGGGIETAGYNSIESRVTGANACAIVTETTGFRLTVSSNTRLAYGRMTLYATDANIGTWIADWNMNCDNGQTNIGSGRKAVSAAPVTTVRLTNSNAGVDTFDAGVVSIVYE